ncbi:MAG: hypothetical protein NC248_06705 [Bacteroides sp.]|uniref:hypothetical protein n=1 Tax=uncultured Muribaculum sp. TaxID=1918613 RepID=UPI0025939823|nr:hypothetical protein [uncultured Muribaculum sp.]MCM1094369.1 hypothetical protein [Lachnospiraceae bacterium]MCM1332282.1 hypothetical protein [Bacteroides sp.]MCM1390512.1 hypothetical protein [Bacteroides sp.]
MNDITELFRDLLQQYRGIDIAESEFKKMIHEDDELHEEYREWCDAVGSSEKMGFIDYCEEFLESQDSIYDHLNDFNDE